MAQASYQSKNDRAYDEGHARGFKDGVFTTLFLVGCLLAVTYMVSAAFRWHDRMVEDSRAQFATVCMQSDGKVDGSGDICRADNRAEKDREYKECIDSLRAKKMPMAAEFRCDYDLRKPGHIIMIRDDERTWK